MNEDRQPKIVFFGNSVYSVIDVRAIYERFGISAVVTIPDRIIKNKQVLVSPVKKFAQERTIPVIESDKLTPEVIELIKKYEPEFLVVADYGLILPKSLLALPIYAPINVHHSLLPKYRGPSPAPSAILGGEKISGVSIIFMTDKVDAGDILKQTSYTLKPDETTDSLLTELNILGSKAIIEVIEQYLAGNIISKKQDEAKATYTTYMKKTDALINLSEDPALNWRKIRAYGKWPGTYFITKKKGKDLKVKIAKAKYDEGTLTIERIIPENGKEMAYDDFLRGLRK